MSTSSPSTSTSTKLHIHFSFMSFFLLLCSTPMLSIHSERKDWSNIQNIPIYVSCNWYNALVIRQYVREYLKCLYIYISWNCHDKNIVDTDFSILEILQS